MTEETPVSWFLIEAGWKVVASDGSDVGTVEETVGDSTHDIFDGLKVRIRLLGASRYVPAEQVGTIVEGRIALKLSADQAGYLREYSEPAPAGTIVPGGGWWSRLVDALRRPRA